jgi:hypothetical protein
MWALQRPRLIDMDPAEVSTPDTPRTLAGLLCHSSQCLRMFVVAFTKADSDGSSNSIGTYAAAMTQQLEQSGVRHLSMHGCRSCSLFCNRCCARRQIRCPQSTVSRLQSTTSIMLSQ